MNEIIIQNTSEKILKNLKFDFYITEINGGDYLGVSSGDFVMFYDWEGENCIGKIDIELDQIFWNKDLFVLQSMNTMYMLQYNENAEDDNVFDVVSEITDKITSGYWYGENLFFYTNDKCKFKVIVGGQSFEIIDLKEMKFVVEYIVNQQRFFFFDNDGKVTTVQFSKVLLSIFERIQQK